MINVIKSMRRKVKLDKNSLKSLIIWFEIKLQINKYILKHKKSKNTFIAPFYFIKTSKWCNN